MTDKVLAALAYALAIDGKEIKSRCPVCKTETAARPEHPLGGRTV